MSAIGVVAIGRNEGERLRRCLNALAGVDATIVYVDSGSTDDSIAMARSQGVDVVELDMSAPFSAARARNAGFERLTELDPGVEIVQFLDGDCEVADGWLGRGRRVLEERPTVAIVFGQRKEQFPERSIYNRLAGLEWNGPIGPGEHEVTVKACGGDALIRTEAFRAVGGYNPSVPAGEEPELCQRLRRIGWLVVQVDAVMTWHDSAMLRFRQWARRQVRTGYGGLDFSTRFGQTDDNPFKDQILSARSWTLGWSLVTIAGALLASRLVGPVAGWSAAGLMALTLPIQTVRIAVRNRAQAGDTPTAVAYGLLTLVGKWFQVWGQLLYLRDRIVGRHARLIEYKSAGARTKQAASSP